jgi:hypothetical protein
MEVPDFLFANLSNLSLFMMFSRLRIKLQIGKELTQNSAPDYRCQPECQVYYSIRFKVEGTKATRNTFAQLPIMATEAQKDSLGTTSGCF